MERSVIILQSLFVLLVTFHVAIGCLCSELDLDDVMCQPELTVVRAKVLSVESEAPHPTFDNIDDAAFREQFAGRRYRMQLTHRIKNGSKEKELKDSIFETVSTGDGSMCGFYLELETDYILIGDVNKEDEISTSLCRVIRWDDLSTSQRGLLEGNRPAPNCDEDSELPDISNDEDVFLS